jgi:hypothetical protein
MIFLWLFMDFQSFSKSPLLFEIRFYRQAPGSFSSSQRYPRFTQNTLGITGGLQCGPWEAGTARLAGIWRVRRRPWPGNGAEGNRGSPWLGFSQSWVRYGRRWGPAAATTNGSRWSSCSGELPARARQRAALAALEGSRAATGSVGLRRSWPKEAAPRRRALAGPTACVHEDGRLQPL